MGARCRWPEHIRLSRVFRRSHARPVHRVGGTHAAPVAQHPGLERIPAHCLGPLAGFLVAGSRGGYQNIRGLAANRLAVMEPGVWSGGQSSGSASG